jgi:hypothetical protein
MFAPPQALDQVKTPSCPTCVEPMSVIRIVKQTPECELRVFTCKHCRILMFTEMAQ